MMDLKSLFNKDKKSKTEEYANETFASKKEKEEQKRKHKIMYISAASIMVLGTIAGIGSSIMNKTHMNQKTQVANSKNNNQAANAILKNGKGVHIASDKDEANSRLAKAKKEAKEAQDAAEGIASAKAAKAFADQEKGRTISTKKSKELIEKAVKEQIKDDKKEADKLQDQISELKKANDKLKKSQDDSDENNRSYQKDLKTAQKRVNDYADKLEDSQKDINSYKDQIDALKRENESLQSQNKSLKQQMASESSSRKEK